MIPSGGVPRRTQKQPRRALRKRTGLFWISNPILPGVYCRRLISDAPRRQPTIRLAVSDFCGIWQVTVCRVAKTLNPGTYACRGSSDNWNPRGRSGGVMAPLPCPLRRVVPKHKSQMPAASRRPPLAARPSKDSRLRLTSGHCAPESGTSTINSRLPKNVITGRLRTSQFLHSFVRSVFGLCSFRLPVHEKDG